MTQIRHLTTYPRKREFTFAILKLLNNTNVGKNRSIKSLLLKQSKMSNLLDTKDCPNGLAIQKISFKFKTRDVLKTINAASSRKGQR